MAVFQPALLHCVIQAADDLYIDKVYDMAQRLVSEWSRDAFSRRRDYGYNTIHEWYEFRVSRARGRQYREKGSRRWRCGDIPLSEIQKLYC